MKKKTSKLQAQYLRDLYEEFLDIGFNDFTEIDRSSFKFIEEIETAPKYTVSRSERYHGNLTSYRFVINHSNASFDVNTYEALSDFFKTNTDALLKKLIDSPIPKKWRKVRRVTSAIKGIAEIDTPKGAHEFPLWRASTEFVRETLTSRAEFLSPYLESRNDVENQTTNLFTETSSPYYEDSSSRATSITIHESILYVETEPLQKHKFKPAKKAAKKRKNRRRRS